MPKHRVCLCGHADAVVGPSGASPRLQPARVTPCPRFAPSHVRDVRRLAGLAYRLASDGRYTGTRDVVPDLTDRHSRLPSRIVLIGLSGSGKSAVARALSSRLGWQAADSDRLIEAEQKRTVPQIFSEDGEQRFRALESEMTARLTGLEHAVISTGGGAPLSAENRARLWNDAFVVRLQASPETLLARIRAGSRPLVSGADPLGRLRALGLERA